MNGPTPSRVVAAVALLGGAFLLVVTALGLVLADDIFRRGSLPVTESDRRTMAEVMRAIPLIVGIAALQGVAGIGLLFGRRWAAPTALLLVAGWALVWAYALVGTVAGWAPFDVSARPDPAAARSAGVILSTIGLFGSLAVGALVAPGRSADRDAASAPQAGAIA